MKTFILVLFYLAKTLMGGGGGGVVRDCLVLHLVN